MLYPHRNHCYTRSWGLLAVPSILRGCLGTHCQPQQRSQLQIPSEYTLLYHYVKKKKKKLRETTLCGFHLKISSSILYFYDLSILKMTQLGKRGFFLVRALYACCMHSAAYKLRKMNLQLLLDMHRDCFSLWLPTTSTTSY